MGNIEVGCMFGISTGKTLVLTEPIKFRVGGSVQTAFWKVRNEPFGSRLCQDGSSERKSPARQKACRCHSFWVHRGVQLGPVLGSFFGVKRCRINELVQIQKPNALPLSYRGTAQRPCFHSITGSGFA
jgi:hypothetical protein